MKKNHAIIELQLLCKHETSNAVLVEPERGKASVWLPKSQIEVSGDIPGYNEISLPEWLAYEKGLI